MPTVVIAYSDFPDTSLEAEVLQAIQATLVRTEGLETPEQLAVAQQADALMVSVQRVPASLLQAMPHCRIVSRMGTGLDAIDIPAATACGIWVTNVPDYAVDEVSTHAIMLLLAQARRLPRMLAATRQGLWDSRLARPYPRLRGQTLGILGLGRIGRATAAKGRGLGLEVIACDPYVAPQTMAELGVRAVQPGELWRESDFLSLHTPLTDETRQIVNAAAMAQMKPSAYLVNTARGGVVDETALLEAVRSGQIAGAALDVLSTEPPPADHPLLHDDRILITPHYAWYSEASNRQVRVSAAEEIVRVWRGQPPRCPANQVPGRPHRP
jgi:D-3-phosphoglycerate dehydrogenase / 2-oxoglutarate reductase